MTKTQEQALVRLINGRLVDEAVQQTHPGEYVVVDLEHGLVVRTNVDLAVLAGELGLRVR
jgi:hypothetical protein